MTNTTLHPFTGMDVWTLLMTRVAVGGDRAFVTWQSFDAPSSTWTYRDLARDAASVASGLARRGVRQGDRVLIHLENSPEFIVSWFACAALGAVAVTTNTRSAPDELAYYARDSGAVGAITQPRFAELVAANAPELRFLVCTDNDSGVPASAGQDPFTALAADPDELPERPVDPLAPMSVQYTSGTTSRPKGVLWTQANALWGARTNAAHETLRPDDCQLVYLPLFHTNALAYSMLATVWTGARMVLIPKWSTSRFWDVSLRHGCTFLSLVGLTQRFLLTGEPAAGHRYRLFGAGMCDLPTDQRYGVKTIGWWGMTETISTPIIGDAYLPNRPLSMGRPSSEYGIRVVRPDGTTPVDPEETGQLQVRGVRGLSMFAEYLNQPDATSASFDADGWFSTGDLVIPHADGHLTFANREKDMLRVGAENVSASEVERAIMGVPGVVEAAVVGRPDDKLDEVPVAFVRAADPADVEVADRISAECARLLADFKVPRAVYLVRDLPRSTLSKIDKKELRTVAGADDDREAAQARWLIGAESDPSGDAR
ncbi:AMP-binding protein [Pseudonocardia spinosispora]|uniref:AMP-binding protein n=1 Tax=Pseudonocardia spinosispora TaxID=103441 RepID=UPI00048D1F67|nr:AMP-binding protein [Pseudonocardia spinosispora]